MKKIIQKIIQKIRADDNSNGISYPYPEVSDGKDGSEQIIRAFLFAFVGHIIIICLLVFVPISSFKKPYTPTIVNVRMVSLGDLRPEGSSGKKAAIEKASSKEEALVQQPEPISSGSEQKVEVPVIPEKKVTVEKKPVPIPIQEGSQPEVSLAPKDAPKEKPVEKPKVKTSLKKETFQPSKVVKSAIEELEKQTEGSRPQSLKDALARLEKDVEKASARGSSDEERTSGGGDGAGSGSGTRGLGSGSGPGGGGAGSAREVYNGLIAYHIQKNWAFSQQLARGQSNLATIVRIKILPTGEIQDIWIDKKSGNQYLDESAIRAIKKSNPLPPLPREIGLYHYEVRFRFTPEGMGI